MTRITVDSKNIKSIGHDRETWVLEVEFNSGLIYQYQNVPRVIYAAALIAPSVGSYLYRNVISKPQEYTYSRLEVTQKRSA